MQNISAPIAADNVTTEINNQGQMIVKEGRYFVQGMILMWSGIIASVPAGFALCDGNNGTPDLRDRFIVGARQDDAGQAKTNITGALTKTGGAATKSLATNEIPDLSIAIASRTDNSAAGDSNAAVEAQANNSQITGATTNTGGANGQAFSLLNPYYALAFIM